jgi:uncharacterized protein YqhQ
MLLTLNLLVSALFRGNSLTLSGMGTAEQEAFDMEAKMLETIIVVLLILWVLGLVSSYTFGGLIHVLLVIALAVLLFRIFQGRNL